jgi:uncharacterized protein (TIGR02117 family)
VRAVLVATVLLAVAAGGCAGGASSAWPPAPRESLKDVWVIRHGWHTRVAVARADVDPSVWPESRELGDVTYLEVGWGDRDFYRKPAPSVWDALDPIVRPTPSALHVIGYELPPAEMFAGTAVVRVRVSADGFRRLTRFIHEQYVVDGGAPVRIGPGHLPGSWFYEARDRYHVLANSNGWTLRALQAAGVPVAPWRALTARSAIGQAEAIGERIDGRRPVAR